MLKTYYLLTKPGIIRGNALVAMAGFLFAAQGNVDLKLFVAMLSGLSLIIASGCVFNNYIDKDIDRVMGRTKNRALVTGEVSDRSAILYGVILGGSGSLILLLFTNVLTLSLALFGLFAYVVMYGVGKRKTVHGTLIGSISGAIPPVVGYSAVTERLDTAALLLFLILVFWQMPHFYAIAMYRMKDYAAAKIPVLPLKKGLPATKMYIVAYIFAFIAAAQSLWFFGYAGYTYGAIMLAVGLSWLWLALRGFKTRNDTQWARSVFGYSLVVILIFSLTISVDVLLP